MPTTRPNLPPLGLSILVVGLVTSNSFAASTDNTEILRRLDILSKEVEMLRTGENPSSDSETPLIAFGPSASKVYRAGRQTVSIGGYGEMLYQNYNSKTDAGATGGVDQIDFLRTVIYVGYRFSDSFIFNSEIEFEHGSTGSGGEVSAEFAYLDWFVRQEINIRAGLVLIPMGFVNEVHEPTTYLGARRTETETLILPTTWRENGIGIFGDIGNFTYRSYLTNGMNSSGFSASSLRSGRQKGANAKVDGGNWAWTARVDYVGTDGLVAGASTYQGQTRFYPVNPTVAPMKTAMYEVHADWKRGGFQTRVLAARARLGSVETLNLGKALTGAASVGEKLWGAYVEAGYDLFAGSTYSLTPFIRFERVNTQAEVPTGFASNPANRFAVRTYGIQLKPIDNIVVKFDYQDFERDDQSGNNQFNAALGYNF
jgi:hypothetical protein